MADPTDHTPPAFQPHDHAACVARALDTVRAACAERGLRLTPMRARVLEILLESHEALGAYDILERLTAEGAAAQPPIAYRALDFLTANGFAHRIESLNAYVACAAPGRRHRPAFLLCRPCGRVAELPDPPLGAALARQADAAGFAMEGAVVELEGTCPSCRARGAQDR